MGRVRVRQEIRVMRFESLLERHEGGTLSQLEAAELLGMSERTFRRWRDRYREAGGEIEVLYIDQAARASRASFDPLAAFFHKHLG